MTATDSKPKPMTKKDLCKLYKISFPTLRRWLADVPGLQIDGKRRHITPDQLEKIFKKYGGG